MESKRIIVNLITSVERYMNILSNVSRLKQVYVLSQKNVKEKSKTNIAFSVEHKQHRNYLSMQ